MAASTRIALALAAGAVLLVGCTSIDEPTAKALYGDAAPAVCGPLEDDPVNLATWARVNRAMPVDKTTELVDYDRLVVDTYCPEMAARFDELLADLHYEP